MQCGTIGGTSKPKEQASPSHTQERKTSKRQAVTPSRTEHPAADGKKQQTVYLPPQLIRAVKHTAVDQDTDISSIVQVALEQYFERLNIRY
jgi:hypothetical protein